jgi:hypothetical protein
MHNTIAAELGRTPPPRDGEAELIAFLALIGRSVETALRARKALLAELLQARNDPTTALERAGHASRRCVRAFDDTLLKLRRARVPAVAADCAAEFSSWLEAHLEACDHLDRAARARDRDDLQQAIQCLVASAPHAQCFNNARERLVRQIVASGASAN